MFAGSAADTDRRVLRRCCQHCGWPESSRCERSEVNDLSAPGKLLNAHRISQESYSSAENCLPHQRSRRVCSLA